MKYFDLVMPAVAMAQGFGRIGCFFAGCCYGRETASWFSIMYTHSDFAPNQVHLIPTQLMSSAGDFLIAAFLLWFSAKAVKDGMTGAMYLILYSVGRFVIEIFRDDARGALGALSTSQIISIGTLLCGVALMYIFYRKREEA